MSNFYRNQGYQNGGGGGGGYRPRPFNGQRKTRLESIPASWNVNHDPAKQPRFVVFTDPKTDIKKLNFSAPSTTAVPISILKESLALNPTGFVCIYDQDREVLVLHTNKKPAKNLLYLSKIPKPWRKIARKDCPEAQQSLDDDDDPREQGSSYTKEHSEDEA